MPRGLSDPEEDTVNPDHDVAGQRRHGERQTGGPLARHPRLSLLIAALVSASAVGLAAVLAKPSTTTSTSDSAQTQVSRPPAPTRVQRAPSETTTSTTGMTGTPLVGPSWASANGSLEPAIPPSAVPDQFLNGIFSDELGPGWIAGDAAYSTTLPDGRVAFVFADTLIGTAQPNGAGAITGLAHSSELVGYLPHLATDYAGTYYSPATLIPDTLDGADTWQMAATYVAGGKQLIFVNEFEPVPGGEFDTFVGQSGVAVMSVPAGGLPSLSSVIPLPTDPDTQWGNALMQSSGYMYVYGSDINPTTHAVLGMKVACVPAGQTLDTNSWDYWNGSAWVGGESNAVAVPTVYQLTGVTPDPDGNGFLAVSVPGGVETDNTIDLSYASSPAGPWTAPQPIYTIPQISQYKGEVAYMPTFHPELSSSDVLVVSYSINTTLGLFATGQDVRSYQPQFLLLSG